MEGVKPFQDKREDSDESGLKKESLQGTSREKRTTKKIRRGSGSPKIDTEKSPSAEGETAKPQAPGEETDDKHGLTVEVEAALQPMEDAGPLPDNREDSDESVGKKERFQGTSRHEMKPKKTRPGNGPPKIDTEKSPSAEGETAKPQAPGEETDDKHGLIVEVEAALQPMEDARPLPDNREDSDESVGKKERFQGTSRHERKPKKTTPESGLLESDHPESDQDKRPRTGGETPKRKRSPSPAPRKKKFPWRQFRGVRLRLERCQKNAS